MKQVPKKRLTTNTSSQTRKKYSLADKWKTQFINNARDETQSRKKEYSYNDALNDTVEPSEVDEVFINYFDSIEATPIENNAYVKYVSAYSQHGVKLQDKYFPYDLDVLNEYYAKVDSGNSRIFSEDSFNGCLLFMMLKLSGVYNKGYDKHFNVEVKKSREFSPLTKLPTIMRSFLPLESKEYDIKRAYPTFIDLELGITNRELDPYSIFTKQKFNQLLNTHSGSKGATLEGVRKSLKPFYGDRVNEVITEDRFYNQGRMYEEMTKYEETYIAKFIEANDIKNYARLHDGVFVHSDVEATVMNIDGVKFGVKTLELPEVLNTKEVFYKVNGDRVLTDYYSYTKFFKQEDFLKAEEKNDARLIVLKGNNKVLTEYDPKTNIGHYLHGEINEVKESPLYIQISNIVSKESQTVIYQSLKDLESEPIKYYKDTKTTFGLPFKNGFFEYDSETEEITSRPYSDVKGFFPEMNIQEHEFKVLRDKESVISQFVKMIFTGKDYRDVSVMSGEDFKVMNAVESMLGYLFTNYKSAADSRAIILTDLDADGESSNGGRGKSLISNIVAQVRLQIAKDGRSFDLGYGHVYSDITRKIDSYSIDDARKDMNYHGLFVPISGAWDIQPKGSAGFQIAHTDSPKILITTNYKFRVGKNDTSIERRYNEYKVTPFFSASHTPEDIFKDRFFEDWDTDEWNRFYTYVFDCYAHYKEVGLTSVKYNKEKDNYDAYFGNEVVESEFIRIYDLISARDSFKVTDFLKEYNAYGNDLSREKLFHKNNVRNLINLYLEYNKITFTINSRREWVVSQSDKHEGADILLDVPF